MAFPFKVAQNGLMWCHQFGEATAPFDASIARHLRSIITDSLIISDVPYSSSLRPSAQNQ